MKPRLTTKVVNHVGQVVERVTPQAYSQVMKPSIATELTQMMTDVVEEGTGQAARLERRPGCRQDRDRLDRRLLGRPAARRRLVHRLRARPGS